jgi:hypothetical protein
MAFVMAKKDKVRTRSAYQTHVSILFPKQSNLIDLTERKLIKLAASHPDENIKKLVTRLLHDYTAGKIAIAWESGAMPVYIFIKPQI